ncbi:MAG: hypothetical protein HWE23_08820 [Rhodobacteraceae bacterium]|nr:hypothetical protein [Paracoccaceae bacterium]
MQHKSLLPSDIVVSSNALQEKRSLKALKADIDRHNLTDMWNMILRIDFQVSSVEELSGDVQDEFRSIVTVLLQAFSDD